MSNNSCFEVYQTILKEILLIEDNSKWLDILKDNIECRKCRLFETLNITMNEMIEVTLSNN